MASEGLDYLVEGWLRNEMIRWQSRVCQLPGLIGTPSAKLNDGILLNLHGVVGVIWWKAGFHNIQTI
jgi:hypothetical protein